MAETEPSARTGAWHERRATTLHHRWYRNLLELHGLTQSWVRELSGEGDADGRRHLLQRGLTLSDEVSGTLWMLERLTGATEVATPGGAPPEVRVGEDDAAGLEALLDDTSPDDLLGRLERAIWTVQAWTLSALLERAAKTDHSALRNQLEHLSWKAGRDCARRRWSTLPEPARGDARGVLAALADAPPFGRPDVPALLPERAVADEVRFELRVCPHLLSFGELGSAGAPLDELCALQAQWIRGFVYELQPALRVDHRIGVDGRRCAQHWRR
jgi:hypothetical protein